MKIKKLFVYLFLIASFFFNIAIADENDNDDAAYSVKDFRTMQFLDWFVKEQGEEETNADNLVKKYELFGDDPKSLYMLDNELGARVYSAPSLVL